MKMECQVIEDLLPLYLDNVCSERSNALVQAHLNECEKCRQIVTHAKKLPLPNVELDPPMVEKAVKKGFQKIRIRWWASILAIIVLLPVLFLSWNQYHNRGVHYTNIDELYIGKAFMKCIDEGDYEKAYTYINVEGLRQEWLEQWFDEKTLENMEEDALVKFCEFGENLERHGGIQGYQYVGISYSGENRNKDIYQLLFKIKYAGEETLFSIMVSNDGVEYFSGNGSFLTDPLAQFAIWSEYLWQSYEGCYFDPDLKEYVYPEQ